MNIVLFNPSICFYLLNISLFNFIRYFFSNQCLLPSIWRLQSFLKRRMTCGRVIHWIISSAVKRRSAYIKWKTRRTVANRIFIDSRQVYESLLYDFLHEFRGNNRWLARKGANCASFRSREACDWPLVNYSRMYLRAKLRDSRTALTVHSDSMLSSCRGIAITESPENLE